MWNTEVSRTVESPRMEWLLMWVYLIVDWGLHQHRCRQPHLPRRSSRVVPGRQVLRLRRYGFACLLLGSTISSFFSFCPSLLIRTAPGSRRTPDAPHGASALSLPRNRPCHHPRRKKDGHRRTSGSPLHQCQSSREYARESKRNAGTDAAHHRAVREAHHGDRPRHQEGRVVSTSELLSVPA